MKRKKPVSVPAPQQVSAVSEKAADQPEIRAEALTGKDLLWPILFSVLLLLAMTVQTGRMSVILLAVALICSVGKAPLRLLRERGSVAVVGFGLFALMMGAAAIYSPFDSDATAEYPKFLAAFALAVLLLTRIEKRHVRPLLWGVSGVCAVIALLCVDVASWGGIFSAYNGLVEALGGSLASAWAGSEGLRVNGIYNDANITGAILGPAILLGWYLVGTAKTLRSRLAGWVLTGVSAVSFLVAMSRGAILCFVLAALVYLIVEREDRLSLFFRMCATAVAMIVAGGVAMLTIPTGSMLPNLMLFLCGPLAFALDWAVGTRLTRALAGKKMVIPAMCLALVVLAGAVGAAALNLTEPYVLPDEEKSMLYRAVSLEPGEYTLSAEWEGEALKALVYSRSQRDAVLEQERTLYSGPVEETTFTVPEDAETVFFQLRGEPGTVIYSATLSDGTQLPMAYKLLPEMVATRLQGGLLQSSSFLQRVQFMADAWKIFLMSPLVGHGLGATENLYTAVQPFYYESVYVHNHVLQVMTETGLVGLLAFLGVLLGSLWLLVRRLRWEADPLVAVLVAVWVMVNAHSLMEINFSVRAFQCFAFLLLLLPVVLYAEPLRAKWVKTGGLVLACGLWVYMAAFGGLFAVHRQVAREASNFSTSSLTEYLSTVQRFANRDVFDRGGYQLSYVVNVTAQGSDVVDGDYFKYVKALRDRGTYTACSGLAEYYYLPRGEFEELFACSREGIAQEASTKEAWNLQLEFYRTQVLTAMGPERADAFAQGVLDLKDYLELYSVDRYEQITLTEENQAFLDQLSGAVEQGMAGESLYVFLTEVCGHGLG